MDEKTPAPSTPEPKPVGTEENPDVQQLKALFAQYGKPALIAVTLAVILFLGLSIWRNQKAAKIAAASQALFQATTPEELQQQADLHPDAVTAPLALAGAAAEYYNANRFEEALETYRLFLAKYPDHLMTDTSRLGLAASFEALDRYPEAIETYQLFVTDRPDSPLRPQAQIGAARCLQQIEKFDEARIIYEDILAANADSEWAAQAETGLLFLQKAERATLKVAETIIETKDSPAVEEAPAAPEAPAAEEVAAPETEAPAAEAAPPVADDAK